MASNGSDDLIVKRLQVYPKVIKRAIRIRRRAKKVVGTASRSHRLPEVRRRASCSHGRPKEVVGRTFSSRGCPKVQGKGFYSHGRPKEVSGKPSIVVVIQGWLGGLNV